jgi:hypothetical protein
MGKRGKQSLTLEAYKTKNLPARSRSNSVRLFSAFTTDKSRYFQEKCILLSQYSPKLPVDEPNGEKQNEVSYKKMDVRIRFSCLYKLDNLSKPEQTQIEARPGPDTYQIAHFERSIPDR